MKRRAIRLKNGSVKLQSRRFFLWWTDGTISKKALEHYEKWNWFARKNVEKINF